MQYASLEGQNGHGICCSTITTTQICNNGRSTSSGYRTRIDFLHEWCTYPRSCHPNIQGCRRTSAEAAYKYGRRRCQGGDDPCCTSPPDTGDGCLSVYAGTVLHSDGGCQEK